jgi:hypothetical protein
MSWATAILRLSQQTNHLPVKKCEKITSFARKKRQKFTTYSVHFYQSEKKLLS